MFAFGVLLFRLLSGERPFPSNNSQVLKRHTIELRYNVQGSDWEGVSTAAKDMVRKLLINDQERLTAEEALQHHWFKETGHSVLRADLTHVGEEHDSRSRAFLFVSYI
jgi:serine/threonine protein kinase